MEIDNQIIDAIRDGKNQWVLNTLYKRTLPKVKALIKKMNGSEEDALDIFQEAVIVFYRQVKMDKMMKDSNLDGFIYSVARNLYLNKLRVSNRYSSFDAMEDLHPVENAVIEDHLEMKDSENEINNILDQLGEKCKEILNALIFLDLDYKEVAIKLGMASGDVVKTQKHRCKKKLEQLLTEKPSLFSQLSKLRL